MWSQWLAPALWLVLVCGAAASLSAQAPLSMTTTTLPPVTAGSQVRNKITVTGGSEPLTFRLSGGKLPPGLGRVGIVLSGGNMDFDQLAGF